MLYHIKLKVANLEIKLVLIYSTNHLAYVLVFKRAHSMSGILVHWASAMPIMGSSLKSPSTWFPLMGLALKLKLDFVLSMNDNFCVYIVYVWWMYMHGAVMGPRFL